MTKTVFNLLKPIKPPTTVWDNIYEWIVGKAKIIILATQVIIAASFFLKVYVDTSAKRKDKEIVALQQQLAFYQDEEEQFFRNINAKDLDYKKLWDKSSSNNAVLTEIYSIMVNPNADVVIGIGDNKLNVSGFDTVENLESLELKLKDVKTFTVKDFTISQEQQEIKDKKARFTLIADIKTDIAKRPSLLQPVATP